MMYEFQVFYRQALAAPAEAAGGVSWPPMHSAPLLSMLVRAETPGEAGELVGQAPGVTVVNVGPGRPLVDWTKPMFNLQETAVLLGLSERTVRDRQAAGELPKPQHDGRTLFRIDDLERYRAKEMNQGKETKTYDVEPQKRR
jgi:hypothetical protein